MIRFKIIREFYGGDNRFVKSKYLPVEIIATNLAVMICAILAFITTPITLLLYGIEKASDLYDYIVTGRNKKKERVARTRAIMEEYGKRLLANNNPYRLNKDFYIGQEDLRKTDMYNFIQWFLKTGNNRYFTYDSVTEKHICDAWRRRSLGDIFLICRYYYPNCTIHGVIEVLVDLLEKKNSRFRASYCGTIEKYVFHTEEYSSYIRDSKVEYSILIRFKDIIETYK